MKTLATYEYKLPVELIYANEYGDTDNFNDEDHKAFKAMNDEAQELLEENGGSSVMWTYEEEKYFAWNRDFSPLGGNVVDATLTIFE
jgi:hypothetical protein